MEGTDTMTKVEKALRKLADVVDRIRRAERAGEGEGEAILLPIAIAWRDATDNLIATVRAEQQRTIKIKQNENSLLRSQVKRLKAEQQPREHVANCKCCSKYEAGAYESTASAYPLHNWDRGLATIRYCGHCGMLKMHHPHTDPHCRSGLLHDAERDMMNRAMALERVEGIKDAEGSTLLVAAVLAAFYDEACDEVERLKGER